MGNFILYDNFFILSERNDEEEWSKMRSDNWSCWAHQSELLPQPVTTKNWKEEGLYSPSTLQNLNLLWSLLVWVSFHFFMDFLPFYINKVIAGLLLRKKIVHLHLTGWLFSLFFFAVCLGNKSWETKSMQSLHYFQTKCVYYMLPVCIMKRTDTKSAIMTTARQRILSVCNSCAWGPN